MIDLRFGIGPANNSLDYYIKSILWMHIYKDEFLLLFKNFGLIKDTCPNIFNEVKEKIETQRVVYEVSSQHPRHKKLINKPFLLILDSFFLNLIEIIEKLDSSNILGLVNTFSDIIQNSDIFDYNLRLKSKELCNFKIIYNIIKFFKDRQINNIKDITLYINYYKRERRALIENRMNDVAEEIQNQINFIYNILQNCEERTKIIMKIILSKYKEIKERNCRELLCDFVLNDMNLIKFSNGFFLYIIKEFSFSPEYLDQNNTNREDNPFLNSVINNQYYPLLDKINQKSKDKILEEYLKYIFKFTIFRYYKVKLSNRKLHSNLNDYSSETEIEIDTYFGE